ncbi:ADP-heptose:LPS heptosyltransferase [Parapedobacter composti]|uniref:ADP-heptose:LPS heptosyltransferase n=1 Tax=Parapedobacter composti TaxID=623281 RepID=A0A1I1EFP4_9SPHI|nr:glycosyltransferase family 9 protein [Parapedobacter composti]SFB85402.1 ADP-heptose:LPS heptosyltransferase [Parapedobacter composti]
MKIQDIRKIAVFRALQLGDLLCAIPAVRALRHQFPQASITLIGLPGAKELTNRFPMYFDGLELFPGYPGLPEQSFAVQDIARFIADMQAKQFDLMLQMQGNGTIVNPLVELFGATYTAGFYAEGHYHPGNDLFIPYPSHVHEICRHLLLVQHLGIPHQGIHLEFPITEQDYADFESLNLPLQPGQYVCVHPGSRAAWRRWPPSAFACMADRCIELGYDVALTGTTEELPIVEEVARLMRYQAIVVAGKTSLGTMAVLVKQAKAVLSNCTGVSHIASALGTPGVIVSMDGEPNRWRPLNKSVLTTIDGKRTSDLASVEKALVDRLAFPVALEQLIDSA